jgi:3-phenylpropionate/trans-cinnamate dioxygenase ferredoxin component
MQKVLAGRLEDFPIGTQKIVELEDDFVLVVHSISGFWAIEDRCSHDDNELFGGEVTDNTIKCPRHGAKFDLATGKALCLPAVKAIKSFTVSLEPDGVYVLSSE